MRHEELKSLLKSVQKSFLADWEIEEASVYDSGNWDAVFEIKTTSPIGVEAVFELDAKSKPSDQLMELYQDFDENMYVAEWLGTGGAPGVRELLRGAEWWLETYKKLAKEFRALGY